MRSVSSFLPLFVVAFVACSARDPGIQYRGNRGGYDPPSAPTGNGGGEHPAYDAGGGPPSPAEPDASTGNSDDASSPMLDGGGRVPDGGYGDGALGDSGRTGDGGSGDSGTTQGLLSRCASDVNAARAQYGLPALMRASDLETFAAQAVVSDAMANVIDGYFANNGGAGVSSAEDELDGAEFDQGAPAQDVMDLGIQYEEQGYLSGNGNLLSQQFTQVGCGVTIAGDGNAWVAIEYR